MKKLSILFACLVTMLGFSSCEDDKDPVYQDPTPGSFVLNVPVLQDQYYELTPEGQIELVCSQPDYGYAAVANYFVEVSLTEDFAAYETITPTGTGTLARMTIKDSDLAMAICALNGFTSEDNYVDLPAGKVYFRAVCEIAGVEGSRITSNVVSLNTVKNYFAVPVPGYIYLIGQCSGWKEPSEGNKADLENWRLFEDANAIGSKIYKGTFNVNAGEAQFRFYTELTGWDGGASVGYQVDDSATNFELNGDFSSPIVKGKGSFNFTNWAGGEMTIVVDMNAMTMTISAL